MRRLLAILALVAIYSSPPCRSFQSIRPHQSRRQTSLPFIATTSDTSVQEPEQKTSRVHIFVGNSQDRKASPSAGVISRGIGFCSPPFSSSHSTTTSCASTACDVAALPVWDGVGSPTWGNWESSISDVKVGRLVANVYAPSAPTSPSGMTQQRRLEQHVEQGTTTTQDPQLAEVRRRKAEWAARYTSLEGLREAFGSNRNRLWGDMDASTARLLYKTLLPTALCELVLDLGVTAEELAPLAYEARRAAKLYARERCRVPARVAANLYDGVRQWKRYGRFQPAGMSYEQVWDKYYSQWCDECGSEEEVVSKTCQTILEKSCQTNEMIDRWLLSRPFPGGAADSEALAAHRRVAERRRRGDMLLREIAHTLEMDFRKILDPFSPEEDEEEAADAALEGGRHRHHARKPRPQLTQQQYHALKHFALALRRSKFDVPPKVAAP